MKPTETLNDESRRYNEIRKMSSVELQRIASLNSGKEGIIARHELEVRMFNANQKLTSSSISLTKKNTILTFITVLLVLFQTGIAWKLAEYTFAAPKLDTKFHTIQNKPPFDASYELRIENMGAKFSDGTYVHLWIPSEVEVSFPKSYGYLFPSETDGNVVHYEWHVTEKTLSQRNSRVSEIAFKLKDPKKFYPIKYLVASAGMPDKSGIFD